MQVTSFSLPLARLDRFWAEALGCASGDLRAGKVRPVPCGQRPVQVLVTPDGCVIIGLPWLLEAVRNAAPAQLLDPTFWASRFRVDPARLAFYGPSGLSYTHEVAFEPQPHPFARPLQRRDAGELARFARILHAREPQGFHSWAIGGRVTANERLWGTYLEGKIVSVAGLRAVAKWVQEVGINTLPHFRKQGWGTAVASAATAGALTGSELVQWSAPLENIASSRIARRLGFLPYAHQLWLTLPDEVVEARNT